MKFNNMNRLLNNNNIKHLNKIKFHKPFTINIMHVIKSKKRINKFLIRTAWLSGNPLNIIKMINIIKSNPMDRKSKEKLSPD